MVACAGGYKIDPRRNSREGYGQVLKRTEINKVYLKKLSL